MPRYLYGEAWKAAYARGAYKKYEEAFNDKRAFAHKADEIVQRELAARLDLLAKSVKVDGPRIVVYNGLPWKRSGLVEVPGQPGQFLFAKDVPAGGYRTYPMDQTEHALPVLNDPPDCARDAVLQSRRSTSNAAASRRWWTRRPAGNSWIKPVRMRWASSCTNASTISKCSLSTMPTAAPDTPGRKATCRRTRPTPR